MASIRKQTPSTPANFSTMSFDIVTIRVGEPDVAVDIPVYREVLTTVSSHFHNAFKGPFKEGTERSLCLTDVSEQTFRIFLQWAHTQTGEQYTRAPVPDIGILRRGLSQTQDKDMANSTDTNVDGEQTGSHDADDGDASGSSPALSTVDRNIVAFDEESYNSGLPLNEQTDECYYKNEEWLNNYRSATVSCLHLYIFADKYSVDQLRDDIMTAWLGLVRVWKWWPDPDRDLIAFAYANLPKPSKFLRFLVLSSAYLWLGQPEADCATRIREMRDWEPDFAFDVSVAQAERLQAYYEPGKGGNPFELDDCLPNSCVLHEHLVHDKEQCRPRIRDNAHVFTTLIKACVEDGLAMAMAEEQGED